ncbi:MAG: hypothetical protein QXP38_13820, partial [Nitrososphaerota archaeon]
MVIFTLVILLLLSMVFVPASMGQEVNDYHPFPLSSNSSGITIDPNGTVVISGNVTISGGLMSSTYGGHGAFFVSGNFIVKSQSIFHGNNISIVFMKNASLINFGRMYLNNSLVTVYNLSINGIPNLNFDDYGYVIGNYTSLEFPGYFYLSSSTAIFTNGYFGKSTLSFSSD